MKKLVKETELYFSTNTVDINKILLNIFVNEFREGVLKPSECQSVDCARILEYESFSSLLDDTSEHVVQ